MHFQPFILALLRLFFLTSAEYHGCNACLGQNEQAIQASCQDHCNDAFNDGSAEHGQCLNGCNIFVRQHHCCVEISTCSADGSTCLKNYFSPPPFSHSGGKKRALPPLEDPNPAITGLVPYTGGNDIESRALIDGETCCLFAQTFLDVSAAKILRFTNGFVLTRDAIVGLSFLAFGLAASHACMKVFNYPCTFTQAGDTSSHPGAASKPKALMGKPPPPPKDV